MRIESGYTRQQRFELEALRIQERAKVIALAVRFSVLGAIVYFSTDAMKALAGETTITDIAVKLFASEGFSKTVAWAFGAGGIGLGIRERMLRHRDTKQLAERLKKYETSMDPERSSSKLDSQGDYGEDD